jgi:hypothetical protein
LPHHRARFVALEFILRKTQNGMVNASFILRRNRALIAGRIQNIVGISGGVGRAA